MGKLFSSPKPQPFTPAPPPEPPAPIKEAAGSVDDTLKKRASRQSFRRFFSDPAGGGPGPGSGVNIPGM